LRLRISGLREFPQKSGGASEIAGSNRIIDRTHGRGFVACRLREQRPAVTNNRRE
jgi:hypothetical protein